MWWINLFGVMLDGFESTYTCGRLVLLIYACLFIANSLSCFHFYLFYHDLPLIIVHGYVLQCCLNKDRFSSCLRHTFGYTLFTCFISSRMMFELLIDSLIVAICHSNWLHSRKYETVWHHLTSSRFYLTIFILC
jgi:hypothetical protein